MKLRNLLFGAMVAVAFTACSDKGEIPEPEVEGTMLGVQTEKLSTRADDTVASLTAYVFNADTELLEAVESEDGATIIPPFEVTEGDKKVIVLANAAPTTALTIGTSDLDDLLEATKLLNTENPDALSMNSRVYEISCYKNVVNYLGWVRGEEPAGGVNVTPAGDYAGKVKLFRNVAKITLAKITLGNNMGPSGSGLNPKYANPVLEIDSVFVLAASGTTLLAGGEGEWTPSLQSGVNFYNGVTDAVYQAYDGDKYIKATPYAQFTNMYANYTYTMDTDDTTTDKLAVVEPGTSFYVYENDAAVSYKVGDQTIAGNLKAPTLLVISGTLTFSDIDEDNNEQRVSVKRYWPVPVGALPYGITNPGEFSYTNEFLTGGDRADEARGDGNYIGIKRNLHYMVGLTINSLGYSTPYGGGDETELSVQVMVVPWGQVNFNFEVE